MAEFIVEVYLRHDDPHSARLHTGRVEHAAAAADREGPAVCCLGTIFVPEDETLLLLFRASSAEIVQEVVSRAGLESEHISAAAFSPLPAGSADAAATSTLDHADPSDEARETAG